MVAFLRRLVRQARLSFYRRFILPLRYFLKERGPLFYAAMVLLLVLSIITLYASFFVADLVYEPEMGKVLPKFGVVLLIFFPVFLLILLIFMVVKVLLDWVTNKAGTRIRSKLTINFLLVTLLPSLVFIAVFDRILKASLDVFFEEKLVASMENSLEILRENVRRAQYDMTRSTAQVLEKNLLSLGNDGKLSIQNPAFENFFEYSRLDGLCVYRGKDRYFALFRKDEPSRLTALVNEIPFSQLPFDAKGEYSFYRSQDDLVFSVRRIPGNAEGGDYYLSGIALLTPNLSPRISQTVDAIRRFKQFEILKEPLQGAFLFVFIYFYAPVLSLGILLFFYRSNRITRPLGRLGLAAESIARGDFSVRVEYRGDDEVKSLVESFRKMSKELIFSRFRLRRMSQMEAWKEVAVRLAHELKNPLTPIQLATDRIEETLTQKHFDTYSELIESFNVIRAEIGHIKDLTMEFSRFSQEVRLDLVRIRPAEFMDRLRETLSQYRDVKALIEVAHPDSLELVVDEKKIRQVFVNLIQNAAESLENQKQAEKNIRLSSRTELGEAGLFWAVDVEDNGPGIPEERREKLFVPYFTTKEKGTGLGLAICEEIVSAHGGRILLESFPGKTVFTVLVPFRADLPETGRT